jgi:hypothetical protein
MHIAGGDMMGGQPAQAELKEVVGDAAGSGSAAGGKAKGVQVGSGEMKHRQQTTIEDVEDDE